MELRRGSPTGQVLATIPVTSTGGGDNYQTQPSVPVTDPGGTNDLFVVFTGGSMDLDEFTFQGPGVTGNASPQGAISAEPTSGTVPLTVNFSAQLTDPEGTPVAITWDFGVAGAPTATTPTASYTYAKRGTYTATLTATDGDGRRIVRTFTIQVNPSCGATPPAASDEFDGDALDYCRWTTILREDEARYRVTGGRLQIDAVDGDMHAGTANARNVLLQDAPDGAWEAVTKVALPQGEEYEQAGLIVHANDRNFAKLTLLDIPGQGWRVEFGQTVDGSAVFEEALDRSGALPAGVNETGIWLRVRSNGVALAGAWSADGQTWTSLGRSRSLGFLPDPKVGLAAFNGNGQAASFDFFRLTLGGELACQTPATPEAGYRMLFDGTAASLGQWRMAGPGAFILQEDCTILTVGGLGLLYHPEAVRSYSLKLDWKMAGDDNAGVFVGFPNPGNDPWVAVNAGHEIQIDATDDPSHTTGAVYGYQAAELAARDAVLKPPGEWNAYEIVVQGDRIRVFLNGVKINDYVDIDPNRMNAPSLIGLQNHGVGDDVFFRNVRIRDIEAPEGPAPTLTVTSPQPGAIINGATATVAGTTNAATAGDPGRGRAGGRHPDRRGVLRAGPADDGQQPDQRQRVQRQRGPSLRAAHRHLARVRPATRRVHRPHRGRQRPGHVPAPDQLDLRAGWLRPHRHGRLRRRRLRAVRHAGQRQHREPLGRGPDLPPAHQHLPRLGDGRTDGGAARHQYGHLIAVAIRRGDRRPVRHRRHLRAGRNPHRPRHPVRDPADEGDRHLDPPVGARRPRPRHRHATAPRCSSTGSSVRASATYDRSTTSPTGRTRRRTCRGSRNGGSAVAPASWNDTPIHDTDTRDPNTLDVIVGPGQTQAAVLDWRAGSPTRLPMLRLQGLADTTAPTVAATLSPAAPNGSNGWYTSPVTVNLTGTDESPGTVKVEYRVNGGAWTTYTMPVVVSADGNQTVEYRATDAAGNVSAVGHVDVQDRRDQAGRHGHRRHQRLDRG